MELAPHLWALGFGVGVLVGLTGMGGGSVMTPALILLGFRPAVVVGTDLVQMAVTKLLGAAQHLRQGTADWKLSLLLAAGSVPGALTGALILPWWEALGISVDDLLRHLVGGMLVLTACALILGLRRPLRARLMGYAPASWRPQETANHANPRKPPSFASDLADDADAAPSLGDGGHDLEERKALYDAGRPDGAHVTFPPHRHLLPSRRQAA